MPGYTKLFSRILDSTIWHEDDETRILWITMLAMADQDGDVLCTIPGLAARARIPLAACERALQRFQQPDKYSWSQEQEGRRVHVTPGGWHLINHAKFRSLMSAEERREKTRIRVAEFRKRQKANKLATNSVTVTKSNRSNASAEAEAEADTKAVKSSGSSISSGNGKIILEGEYYNNSKAPPDLHPLNYATKILDEIEFPLTQDNLRVVAAAIEAEVRSGKTKADAFQFVLAGTKSAQTDGIEINRFFFADAKYRSDNRNKNNGHTRQTVAERNRRVIDEFKRLGK
jgi:hypothetical protein